MIVPSEKPRIEEAALAAQLACAGEDNAEMREQRDQAEAVLLREYRYHALRAEELRDFLEQRGHGFPED